MKISWHLQHLHQLTCSLCSIQVAVKKMKRKFCHWEECISLREVKVFSFVKEDHIHIQTPFGFG
jgi:hypothetical protein